MVALLALDGRQYVYRVYAPRNALAGDLFWTAFHCHDEGPHPRASDRFDSAAIWRSPPHDRPIPPDPRSLPDPNLPDRQDHGF